MSHTPGPWVAFFKHKYGEWHVSVPVDGSSMLLGLFPNGVPTSNAEADAKLIAAAPDLLAALEAICADPYGCPFCDSGRLRNQNKPHDENCGFALATAALAKARGAA